MLYHSVWDALARKALQARSSTLEANPVGAYPGCYMIRVGRPELATRAPMTDLPVASRVIWASSFLLAVETHVALVLPWVWHEPDALAGAGGQELNVISFILADPGVLETREVDQINLAVPAPADAVEEKEGSAEEKEPKKEETKELQEPPKPEKEVPKPDAILEEAKPKPEEKSKQQERSVTGGAASRQSDHSNEAKGTSSGKRGEHSAVCQIGLAGARQDKAERHWCAGHRQSSFHHRPLGTAQLYSNCELDW